VENILQIKILSELPPPLHTQIQTQTQVQTQNQMQIQAQTQNQVQILNPTTTQPTNTVSPAKEVILVETESFLKPRLAQYIENRKNEIGNVLDALARKDYEHIITIGHNVAGTAGIYGMMALSELARKLEQAAIEANIEKIAESIREMESYIDRVRF
jgi:HPt (histidine-containing phosphotransfer) domain-containing protein